MTVVSIDVRFERARLPAAPLGDRMNDGFSR
jgi:hypothetical protein